MVASDVLLFLLLDLVIIIVASRTFGWAARCLGQAAVVGEIAAGILLGPTVLGRIVPGASTWLFPPEVPLQQIADLGLILFMFLVGLEVDARLLRQEGGRAAAVSLMGVLLPFGLGAVLASLMLDVNNQGTFLDPAAGPAPLAFALFMGAAMCITAFPVLARILVESKLQKTQLGTTALCAAAVDDVIGWMLLAVVVAITKSGSPTQALPTLALAAAFAVFMATVARRLVLPLARRHDVTGRLTADQVALVLAGAFLAACVTEVIGIHSIFGAFLFGVVMSQHSGIARELTDKLGDFTTIVLLPVFFTVSGLRTNLLSLNSLELLGWLGLILLVAIGGKLLGCGLATLLIGSTLTDAAILGVLMNTRGLTELVMLSVGLNLGVLSDRTFAMMTIMALVTTLMAAPIVGRLLPLRADVCLLARGSAGRSRARRLSRSTLRALPPDS